MCLQSTKGKFTDLSPSRTYIRDTSADAADGNTTIAETDELYIYDRTLAERAAVANLAEEYKQSCDDDTIAEVIATQAACRQRAIDGPIKLRHAFTDTIG